MARFATASVLAALCMAPAAWSAPVFTSFDATGLGAVTATRDAFRAAIGGGTVAGANGSFGGLRREINWDGVPNALADPNALPADFFNVNSPRGVVFSTPGTGFMVSANAGLATPALFGFGNDFATFSAQRLFTAINSNTTDVSFFLPGTTTAATTSAFGAIFTDAEVAGLTRLEFFDENNALMFSHDVLTSSNQGLSFAGVTVTGGAIGRVRITAGANTIVANGQIGNPNDDVVVMDDFLYAEPIQTSARVSEPAGLALGGMGLLMALMRRRSLTAGADRARRAAHRPAG